MLLEIVILTKEASKSAIVPAHQALRMTFDYYPDLSNISQGPRGRSTLFLAALNGRRTAIELIEMHIKRHTLLVPGEFNRVFFDMLNTPSSEKTCVLDAAAAYVQEVVSDETMEESGKAVKRKEAIETFKYLRERGARMGHEQRGVVLR
jgi:hypothetical protein